MKIVGKDNHARETVGDVLWIDNIKDTSEVKEFAQRVCDKLNSGLNDGEGYYYSLVPDDAALWGGMRELV